MFILSSQARQVNPNPNPSLHAQLDFLPPLLPNSSTSHTQHMQTCIEYIQSTHVSAHTQTLNDGLYEEIMDEHIRRSHLQTLIFFSVYCTELKQDGRDFSPLQSLCQHVRARSLPGHSVSGLTPINRLTSTAMGSLQCTVHLICLSVDCGRKPKHPKETHTDITLKEPCQVSGSDTVTV